MVKTKISNPSGMNNFFNTWMIQVFNRVKLPWNLYRLGQSRKGGLFPDLKLAMFIYVWTDIFLF